MGIIGSLFWILIAPFVLLFCIGCLIFCSLSDKKRRTERKREFEEKQRLQIKKDREYFEAFKRGDRQLRNY